LLTRRRPKVPLILFTDVKFSVLKLINKFKFVKKKKTINSNKIKTHLMGGIERDNKIPKNAPIMN
jgi:hypothetical protein